MFVHNMQLFLQPGLHNCFTAANCTGDVITEAADQRDCCVGTNDGLSYNNGSTCNRCVGTLLINMCRSGMKITSPASQFMDLKTPCMMFTKMTDLTQCF